MKTPRLRLLSVTFAVLSAFCSVSRAADTGSATTPATSDSSSTDNSNNSNNNNSTKNDKKPHTIMLLDGSVLFGKVELTDDYTLKVSSDSGIQKIALSMLGESDFKKYGFGKDRSQDGRFWSDRQDAVSDQQRKDGSKSDKSKDDGMLEISLAELVPFQSLISSYQKDNPKKDDSAGGDQKDKDKTASTGSTQLPFTPLFSQPGMSSLPTSPLNALGTGGGMPAVPGGGLLPTPSAGLPGLPTAP